MRGYTCEKQKVLLKHSGEVIKCEETICNCCPENAVDAPVYLFQRSGKHDKQDSRMWEQEIKEITSIIDVSMENANQLLQAPDMHEICHDVPHRASECRLAAQNAVQACARIAEEHRLMLQIRAVLGNSDKISTPAVVSEKNVATDVSIVRFRGRSKFKQYMPNEKQVCNQTYVGEVHDSEGSVAGNVIMCLMHG
nr:unnamed protein product [Haemonchus contortus]